MDPDENLQEQRKLIARANAGPPLPGDMDRLVELVEAMDEWLSRGSALPAAWQTRSGR